MGKAGPQPPADQSPPMKGRPGLKETVMEVRGKGHRSLQQATAEGKQVHVSPPQGLLAPSGPGLPGSTLPTPYRGLLRAQGPERGPGLCSSPIKAGLLWSGLGEAQTPWPGSGETRGSWQRKWLMGTGSRGTRTSLHPRVVAPPRAWEWWVEEQGVEWRKAATLSSAPGGLPTTASTGRNGQRPRHRHSAHGGSQGWDATSSLRRAAGPVLGGGASRGCAPQGRSA